MPNTSSERKPRWHCSKCESPIYTPRHSTGICLSCRVAGRGNKIVDVANDPVDTVPIPKTAKLKKDRIDKKKPRANPKIMRENTRSNSAHVIYEDGSIGVVSRDSHEYQLAAAQKIMAERTLMRRRFLPFVQKMNSKYEVAVAHEILARVLEQFLDDSMNGRSPRVMVTFPPRHGKSEQTSRKFPAWALGKYPEAGIILASYGMDLAEKMSRDILSTVKSQEYRAIFPDLELVNERIDDWATSKGGGVRAAGVGVGVTGMGCHMLIIDDPFKDRESADSETIREKTWDWYTSTALTRLTPGGGVLLINTRWHDDDLSGRLCAAMQEDPEYEKWKIVNFAALAENDEWLTQDDTIVDSPLPGAVPFRKAGEALHEARYSRKYLLNLKRILHARDWNSLYQQNPVPDDGEYFKSDYFIEHDPGDERYDGTAYIAVDFAITEKQTSDYTVIAAGLHMPNDTIHVDDIIRMRTGDSSKVVTAILDTVQRYKSHNPVLGVEDGQIWKSIRPYFEAEAKRRKIYVKVELLKPLTDKSARARPLQGRMANHMVTLRRGARWIETMKAEFLRFPVGRHDDIVDALAWMAQLILTKNPPLPLSARRPRRGDRTVAQQLSDILRGVGNGSHMSA
ncbi:putative terminase, large subunit [Pseudomonas phage KPP25]|uniref:Putative terminase, large subunit n=1 Tax=Pseudomonas phage KPP25 TaxID=1462608 RepID=X5IGD1_BPKP2|nr:terminase large subunit [Pseudomonas phage KPP25]BAO58493.1 putative terminase, large subunit [Pseudomonas phage KPP25]